MGDPVSLLTAEEYLQKKTSAWPHVLLDVRGQDEWNGGHVEGAQLLPHWFVPLKAKEYAPDPSVPVVVYCASGGRSAVAARALEGMGYQQVFDVQGGYGALRAAGA